MALLLIKKITVSTKYANFADVFLKQLAKIVSKRTGINEHAIKWINSKEPSYGLIYSLGLVELGIINPYITRNLANSFIQSSKSPTEAPIIFVQKANGSLCLYVNYQSLNNLTIKNLYPLLLIDESLETLRQVKCFTLLNLTSTYYRMRIKKGNEWKTAFKTYYGHFEY